MPSNDGGSPISGYVVEYRIVGAFKWVRSGEYDHIGDTHYTVKNLNDDFEYEFRVAAENKAGKGPYSQCSMPIVVSEPIGEFCRFFKPSY